MQVKLKFLTFENNWTLVLVQSNNNSQISAKILSGMFKKDLTRLLIPESVTMTFFGPRFCFGWEDLLNWTGNSSLKVDSIFFFLGIETSTLSIELF